jgi:Zn-dependent peptidase ImmA (M78 family)
MAQVLVSINPDRIKYLLNLYDLTKEDLVDKLNAQKEKLTVNSFEILIKDKVKISFLKKIDKIFNKGLAWYVSKLELPKSKEVSIFFRKDKFNSDLNLESKKITSKFEELKFEIENLADSVKFNTERKIQSFNESDNPKGAALKLREFFENKSKEMMQNGLIKKADTDSKFLKNLIRVFETQNIFIFEFIDNYNKKEKTSFNGFFIKPGIIVLRKEPYLRREIFTFLHELGHYLINSEEIDYINEQDLANDSKAEKWCNEFAYHFLAQGYEDKIDSLSKKNNYEDDVDYFYKNTHLSRSAIYYRLYKNELISKPHFERVLKEIQESLRMSKENERQERKRKAELAKLNGEKIKGFGQKPIESKLFKEIVVANYFEGNIRDVDLCNYLKIKPDKIKEAIYE